MNAIKQEECGPWVENFIKQLVTDKSTTFSAKVDHFTLCTIESEEKNPHKVMRNIRQFLSGMNRYLMNLILRQILANNIKVSPAVLLTEQFLKVNLT